MSEACSDIKFIRRVISEISLTLDKPTAQYCDKTVAATWAESSEGMRSAKHINLKYYFVKKCNTAGPIDPRDPASEENPVDGIT